MSGPGFQKRRRLGDILVENGIITPEQLKQALEYQQTWGHKLGTALVAKRFITEDDLVDVLSRELRLQTADPMAVDIPQEVLRLVPARVAAEHDLIPIGVSDQGGRRRLLVATSDPMNIDGLSAVRAAARLEVEPVLATMASVAKAIHKRYGVMSAAAKLPAYADAEMVIVHPGGKEMTVGPDGRRQESRPGPARDPFDDPTTRRQPRLAYKPDAQVGGAAAMPPPQPIAMPMPMPVAMPVPMPGFAPMPNMLGPPAMPFQPPQFQQPFNPFGGAPMQPQPPPPLATAPTPRPQPQFPPPPTPSPVNGVGTMVANAATVRANVLQAPSLNGPAGTAPPATPPAQAASRPPPPPPVGFAPTPQGAYALDEIGKTNGQEVVQAIVRLLVKKGVFLPEELLAEIRRRNG